MPETIECTGTLATVANMRKYHLPGVFAYDPLSGEEYSADPNDYWDARHLDIPLTSSEGNPMYLVRKVTEYRDVEDGSIVVGEEW